MEGRIVVSDNGDVWSPKMAPASTAPNMGIKSERSIETTISAAIGRIRPKVPNVLPIEKEMKQARTNKRAGSSVNGFYGLCHDVTPWTRAEGALCVRLP